MGLCTNIKKQGYEQASGIQKLYEATRPTNTGNIVGRPTSVPKKGNMSIPSLALIAVSLSIRGVSRKGTLATN